MSNDTKWEVYLDERPEFRRWCEYISKSGDTSSTYMDRIN